MLSRKATVLCLLDILKRFSDEEHPITTEKIIEKLKVIYDIDMERRAVYRNISVLNEMGFEVIKFTDNRGGYCLLNHDFEMSEIRLLCDAVASSRSIPESESRAIIKKLLKTQSIYRAGALKGTIYIKQPYRAHNMQIFYNIDMLNIAITQCCCASVQLMKYNINKELEILETLTISPYCTVWSENNYYVICFNEDTQQMAHYRIDKLKNITPLEREATPMEYGFNAAEYTQRMIVLNGEQEKLHEITCSSEHLDDLIESFGTDISIKDNTDGTITALCRTTESKIRIWNAKTGNTMFVIL